MSVFNNTLTNSKKINKWFLQASMNWLQDTPGLGEDLI